MIRERDVDPCAQRSLGVAVEHGPVLVHVSRVPGRVLVPLRDRRARGYVHHLARGIRILALGPGEEEQAAVGRQGQVRRVGREGSEVDGGDEGGSGGGNVVRQRERAAEPAHDGVRSVLGRCQGRTRAGDRHPPVHVVGRYALCQCLVVEGA